MKKYTCLVLLAVVGAAVSQCATQKKVEYHFDPHVTAENRALYLERAEKGRILFKEHCTGCHGVFARARDGMPDFTQHQIDNYNARTIAQSGSHTTARKLSGQQLDYILTFLRLRVVKNPVTPPGHPPASPSN